MAKLLIIDDSEPDKELLRINIDQDKHELYENKHPRDIMTDIEQIKPDLVLLDLVMPEKEGMECIVEIRNNFPEQKILVMSGKGQEYMDIAITLGAKGGVAKNLIPFKINEIIENYLK